ncbi:uncharacterized protein LOC125491130 [Plutella xylostella]|uniref:uncharacterized protein LOC125491130 n=1 Tax=Plutella xylostella TaxID=51655 RepID=UPI0020327A9D|nr:uncharacterized protein LOC125491130 [Plutella xylostella]
MKHTYQYFIIRNTFVLFYMYAVNYSSVRIPICVISLQISEDQATCTKCDKTMTWKSVDTLKKHLQRKHPEVTGIGDHDDPEIPSSPLSPPRMKLIKVDPLDKIPSANKKRKLDPAADNEPITTKQTTPSLDRFNSLNQFGLYVASLLKLLPRKRCIKYQNQIVDRLLKDLAAAA